VKTLEAPWWVTRPEIYAREIQDLRARGIRLVNEGHWQGHLVLKLDVPIEGTEGLRVTAVYPTLFPYFRPQVQPDDDSFTLKRHQHPFGKHFCLLANSEKWHSSYTLAWLLQAQLPQILKFSARDAAELKDLEEPVGESVANYYDYQEHACVFTDSAWQLDPALTEGKFQLAYSDRSPLRGVVKTVFDSNDKALVQAPTALASLFPNEVWARWVRVEEAMREQNPAAILDTLDKRFPELARHQANKKSERPLVTGVVFRDELQQGVYGDNWVFILRGAKPKFIRNSRAGASDFAARVPELAPVRAKTVTTLGLGSLGMPSAMEFARAGIHHMKAADFDFVEAGSTVRWPIGLTAAALKKDAVLQDFVARNYPYTIVTPFHSHIGHVFNDPENADQVVIPQLLNTDLVYDATADWEVNHAFSNLAAEGGVPYVCISTTPGGWGGLVFRQRVGSERACWSCLQHYLTDESVETPRAKPDGTLQPAGCASVTFTGANFDGGMIALMGVRLAISTLCAGHDDAYPDVDWDCAVVQLRDENGTVVAPSWRTYQIGRHPNCHGSAHKTDVMDATAPGRANTVPGEQEVPA
jgi:molybdopterin/thiamine biosynthesis adenylyltransferase